MPKAKPTSINVHRIEAGEWERQNILRPVADIAKITKSVQAGAVTIVCVGVGLAGYSAYWFLKKTGGWASDAKQSLDNLLWGDTPADARNWSGIKRDFGENQKKLEETKGLGRIIWDWLAT